MEVIPKFDLNEKLYAIGLFSYIPKNEKCDCCEGLKYVLIKDKKWPCPACDGLGHGLSAHITRLWEVKMRGTVHGTYIDYYLNDIELGLNNRDTTILDIRYSIWNDNSIGVEQATFNEKDLFLSEEEAKKECIARNAPILESKEEMTDDY